MRTQEVLIVVRRADEFLVVHRSPENDGYWHQIAGGVEEGETFVAEAPADWEPTLDWEHDDHRWLPRDEAAELLYWPEPAALLRSLP